MKRYLGLAVYIFLLIGGLWSIAAGVESESLDRCIGGAFIYLIGRDVWLRTRD